MHGNAVSGVESHLEPNFIGGLVGQRRKTDNHRQTQMPSNGAPLSIVNVPVRRGNLNQNLPSFSLVAAFFGV